MTGRRGTKFVHEGQYAAAVEIQWLESETGWSPCLSWQDAQKLDEVREALRRGDLQKAEQLARTYQLTPLQLSVGKTLRPGRLARLHERHQRRLPACHEA